MSNEDVQSTLRAIELFLRQQREVSGNVIYSSPSRASERMAAKAAGTEPLNSISQEWEAPMARQKKLTPTAHPAPMRAEKPAAAPAQAKAAESPCGDLWKSASTLAKLNEYIRQCADCPLAATRTNFVFGVGPSDARAMVIGEAPGADEDAQGEPFVGRAGQLLNKILEAVQLKRGDVFIANILKCRPPNNRRPLPSEVEHCEPYLWKQIELIKPKIILCLGLTAAQTLLKTTASLGTLRESVQEYRGIPLVVTYHPAALLRNPNWKRPTWDDVKKFRKLYDEHN